MLDEAGDDTPPAAKDDARELAENGSSDSDTDESVRACNM